MTVPDTRFNHAESADPGSGLIVQKTVRLGVDDEFLVLIVVCRVDRKFGVSAAEYRVVLPAHVQAGGPRSQNAGSVIPKPFKFNQQLVERGRILIIRYVSQREAIESRLNFALAVFEVVDDFEDVSFDRGHDVEIEDAVVGLRHRERRRVPIRCERIVHGCDTRATHALVASSNKRPFTSAGRACEQTSERRRQRDDALERT